MNNLFQRLLPKGGFARSVAALTGATAFSQLIALGALPILTRLYSPDEYGAAAAYIGIVSLIAVISTFRYEFAIPLPKMDRAGLHVATAAAIALALITVLSGLASPLLHLWFGPQTGLPMWGFALLIIIGVLTAGAYQIANNWAMRQSNFGAIARTRMQQGLAGTGSQILLGVAGFGVVGLALGQVIGQCAGFMRLAAAMLKDVRQTGFRAHRRGLAWAVKRYRRFPLYDSWAGLLNVAGAQAPVLLFAALFSPVLAGYYALSLRILSAPIGLIGKAISQPLLPRMIAANRKGEAGPLLLGALRILAWLSFFPFTVAALLAKDLTPIVLGPAWGPAGEIMAWTALWTAWQFVTSPLSVAMTGLEALRQHTLVQLTLFVLRVGGIMFGVAMGSQELAVIGFSVASMVGYGVYLSAIGSVAGIGLKAFVLALVQPLAYAAACALAFYFAREWSPIAAYGVIILFGMFWLWQLRPSKIRQLR